MKALAIDSASACMLIAARNEENTVTVSLDVGTRQSEKLLPTIDYVLDQVGLTASELEFTALCKGPGTFTGLRLAFSALKAIELAYNVPIYAVNSLETYAYPFKNFDHKVISVIDAKKDQFFAAIYKNGEVLMEAQDTSVEAVLSNIEDHETVITVGPDASLFANALQEKNSTISVICTTTQPPATDALFELAKKMPALQEYEGPAYLRKSEAELSLERH